MRVEGADDDMIRFGPLVSILSIIIRFKSGRTRRNMRDIPPVEGETRPAQSEPCGTSSTGKKLLPPAREECVRRQVNDDGISLSNMGYEVPAPG